MKRVISIVGLIFIAATLLIGCNNTGKTVFEKHRSIYHWKSTFELDSTELLFLQKHNIDRLYLKMFDVATERDMISGRTEVVPIATTKFISKCPEEVEIVPVVYITIEALRAMNGKEAEMAELIVERTLAMCNYNKCGEIKELQLDCDWTSTTKGIYEKLCDTAHQLLRKKGVNLSITVRLHQLGESAPPADRGVLMLYNTGQLKSRATKNSILDIADVKSYVKRKRYPLPLDYAYPAFGWGIKFKGEEFAGILSDEKAVAAEGEYIRRERATANEILEVKVLVEDRLGKPASGNILYHLDHSQLTHYTDYEISQILYY